MKQAVIVVGLVLLFSFIISGGFSVKNSDEPIPSPAPVIGDLTGEGSASVNERALQLRNLKFTNRSPVPSTAPSTNPSCQPGQKVAVDLLLDTSGSMYDGSKIYALRDAVINFAENLQSDDVVGIQIFDTYAYPFLPIGLYNKPIFDQKVIDIVGSGGGNTNMREAFELAKNIIEPVKPDYPEHTWVLIFLSDGFPSEGFPLDPTVDPNIPDQIKGLDVTIITIGLGTYYSINEDLLRRIASNKPNSQEKYYYHAPSGDDLDQIYQDIARLFCR